MSKKILEIQIDQLAFGGEALASHEGKKIFIPWGVPGDRIKIEIVEDRKDFSRGKILEILEESSHRTQPPCPYFFRCGGCQWQQISYPSQVEFKTELLKTALQRIGKITNPQIQPTLAASHEFHYRNRIRLQVSKQGEVGFFKLRSKEVVSIEKCLIADEKINSKISEAKEFVKDLLKEGEKKLPEIEIRLEKERAVFEESSSGEAVFTQVNSAQNELLRNRILESLNPQKNQKILELFAGDGNFTFPIAKLSERVMAVESNTASVEQARKKGERAHFRNIQWVEATAHRALQQFLEKNESFDALLIDPPRKGALEILETIGKLQIPKLIYVSCDPSTLARDLKILIELGYKHDFSQGIDLFPQTYHLESITRLIR